MTANASIELSELLPSSIDDLGDEIRRHMDEECQVGGRVAWAGAAGAALSAIRDKLSFDVVGCIGSAWAEAEALREYGDPKKHPPGRDEHFALGRNHVELEAEPLLVIRLGPLEAPPMKFGYTVKAEFEAVMLTIRDGAIQAAKLAGCEVTGVLSLKGHELHEPCRLAKGRLPGELAFDPPVRIP
jgi:hypothetical protein